MLHFVRGGYARLAGWLAYIELREFVVEVHPSLAIIATLIGLPITGKDKEARVEGVFDLIQYLHLIRFIAEDFIGPAPLKFPDCALKVLYITFDSFFLSYDR